MHSVQVCLFLNMFSQAYTKTRCPQAYTPNKMSASLYTKTRCPQAYTPKQDVRKPIHQNKMS